MWIEWGLRRRKHLENWRQIAETICRRAKQLLGDVRVYVFGSIARGDWGPNSDIDILIVGNVPQDPIEIAKTRIAILETVDPDAPVELHLATPQQYENWYRRFIDKAIEICNH